MKKAYAEAVAEVITESYGDLTTKFAIVGRGKECKGDAGDFMDVRVRRTLVVPLEPPGSAGRDASLGKAVESAYTVRKMALDVLDDMIQRLKACREELADKVFELKDESDQDEEGDDGQA